MAQLAKSTSMQSNASADASNAIFFVGWPERFHLAERYADEVLMLGSELTDSDKLLLESLRSQANNGPCTAPRPSLWDKEAMARWSSWRQLKNMSVPEAMNLYVRAVGELDAEWWRWPPLGVVEAPPEPPAEGAPAGGGAWREATDGGDDDDDDSEYVPGEEEEEDDDEEEDDEEHGRGGEAAAAAGAAGGTRAGGAGATLAEGDGAAARAQQMERMTRSLAARAQLTMQHGWQPMRTSGLAPRAHYRHAAAVIGAHMYVFGGRTHGGRLPEGVRVLSLLTCEWWAPEVEGAVSPRWAHTMNAWRHMVVVFGGHRKREYLNDIALLDTHNLCWVLDKTTDARASSSAPGSAGGAAAAAGAATGRPSARAYHSAALIYNTLYVFGGEGAAGLLPADVHALDLLTLKWRRDACTGAVPPPVRDHVAAAVGTRMIVVGGSTASGYVDGSQLSVLETAEMTWARVPCRGAVPSARAGHAAALTSATHEVGADLCIFGGGDGTRGFADLFRLDLSTNEWAKVSSPADGASGARGLTPREGATCVAAGTLLVVFGGYTALGCSADTYTATQGISGSALQESLLARDAAPGRAAGTDADADGGADAMPEAADRAASAPAAAPRSAPRGEGMLVLLASADAQEVGAAQEVFARALSSAVLGVNASAGEGEWQPVGHDEALGAALQRLELLQLQLARAPPDSPARRAVYLASSHCGLLPVSAASEERWFLFYWAVVQHVPTGRRASAMSAGIELSAALVAKARETRFTRSVLALAREEMPDGRAAAHLDVQEQLTRGLMTMHAQLTEAWYSAIGALLAAGGVDAPA